AFPPNGVCGALVVDGQAEVIAEREAEARGKNVIIEASWTRELRFGRPGGSAISRTTIVGIPQQVAVRLGSYRNRHSSIHPGDADIARDSGCDGREAMLNVARGAGDVSAGGPACA